MKKINVEERDFTPILCFLISCNRITMKGLDESTLYPQTNQSQNNRLDFLSRKLRER